jgi:hypothetical protein
MAQDMNTTTDVIAALAADPQVQTAKRLEKSETERLERLLAEQAGLTAKIAELPATSETRAARVKLRASLTEITVEVDAARHEIALRHRDVQRAERLVAHAVGVRITGEATALGQTIFTIATDLVGEFSELQALEVQSRTVRSIVAGVDAALGEQTPTPPGVSFASGTDPATWASLVELRNVVTTERARRDRIRAQAIPAMVTVN